MGINQRLNELSVGMVRAAKSNHLSDALRFAQEIYDLDPTSEEAAANLIYLLTKSELFERAGIIAEYFSTKSNLTDYFLLNLSHLYLTTGEHESLANLFSRFPYKRGEELKLSLNRVLVYLYLNNYALALELCKFCIATFSSNQISPSLLAALYTNKSAALIGLERFEELANLDLPEGLVSGDVPDEVTFEFFKNKAFGYIRLGHTEKALPLFERLTDIRPLAPGVMGAVAYYRQHLAIWDGRPQLHEVISDLAKEGNPIIAPFFSLCLFDDPILQMKIAENWVKNFLNITTTPRQNIIEEPKKINKIGFLSTDFYYHATLHLMADFLVALSGHVEVHLLSIGPTIRGTPYERLLESGILFHDLQLESDYSCRKRIKDLELDCVVDVKGHCNGARQKIFSERLAPLQISYLAYPGTTATPNMDLVILDNFIAPKGDGYESFYTERIVRLETCYQPNGYLAKPMARNSRDHIKTIGYLGNSYKITPEIFGAWCRLLLNNENLDLVLLVDNEITRENLVSNASGLGIANPRSRLKFLSRASRKDYLTYFSTIDLFVDTYPYGSHTTASDCIAMGVPIVTLVGKTFSSRVCGSILTAGGCGELVCQSLSEYEGKINTLVGAKDVYAKAQELLSNYNYSALFNPDAYARSFLQAIKNGGA